MSNKVTLDAFYNKDMCFCGFNDISVSKNDTNFKYAVFPGFVDVHVHLREPGFSYKETILDGTLAAAHGGYTDVCAMPNLKPVPDSLDNLKIQLDIIKSDAKISVYPYGAMTVSEMGEKYADVEKMYPYVIGFSDDGRGVQDDDMMRSVMERIKKLDGIIAAHCEVNSLLDGGYIHAGEYASLHGHRGICSESEWKMIERDLKLVEEIGCRYHVCHISTKESVEIIRQAKKNGVNVTCETGPHYLVFNDMMLKEEGRFKMNPPIRSEEDRLALLEGIKDGTIDMIATDHAPHSAEEKSRGLEKSLMGVVGIETAFPVLYTHLVKTGTIPLEKLIHLMSKNPRDRFNISYDEKTNFCIYDLESEYTITPDDFLSKGRSTPFEGDKVFGKCMLTVCDGKVVYKDKNFEI